ncbi:hypothetical protein MNEG_6167 [Monoraphidium neglectum]|uniref:Uncharacterized protein n=1 Tax=Monoraphidium neglectum TaxID=145388 RepID=A0A0D2MML2_9CHLO|nr:hypothetical protein MNEG_6167 [Monoraphidium neglectum]KIZ01792.1 hypothetical protein MNEG_6167 [Monoraphidium neglectum]|eukprot:XP_013900811.1 hypothetical protein MNEG_6167 [Monoraphidium neglectum]
MATAAAAAAAALPSAVPEAARTVDMAEEALHAGKWLQARSRASEVLAQQGAALADVTRAFYVLLQVDFHAGRLTDLKEASQFYGRDLQSLPVTVILLWGVIALEMEAGAAARAVLGSYTARLSEAAGAPLPSEDHLALSRLYAVRVLRGACGDAAGARAWLLAGGAGLSDGQRQLLLTELEDTEAAAHGCSEQREQQQREQQQQAGPSGGLTEPSNGNSGGVAAAAAGWAEGGLGQPGQFFTVTGEIEEIEDDWPTPPTLPAAGSAAAAAHAAGAGPGGRRGGGEGQGEGGQQQQQGVATRTWAWAVERAGQLRAAPVVQDTLRLLHLEDVPAWQIAGGAAAAALVAFSVYRERRGIRRAAVGAASGLLAGLSQVAAMATGFEPNAMAAVPRPQ